MLFHVTIGNFAPGDLIPSGHFGHQVRVFRPGGPMPTPQTFAGLLWEVALEAVRSASFPAKPSRLDCVFAFETYEDACAFRDAFQVGGSILRIKPETEDAVLHRGRMDLLNAGHAGTPYIDYMTSGTISYWRDEPNGAAEVLIPGCARVIESLS